jgi:hypothetical protein
MAKSKLSDGEAKDILREWPTRTKKLWHTSTDSEYWLQALPKPMVSAATSPRLHLPATTLFATQPDGMWVYLKPPDYVNVIAVEVCGTSQNLNDKRSRYFPSGSALLVTCPKRWLVESIQTPEAPRWKACGSISVAPTADVVLPVRHLRVLYALPNELYADWVANGSPAAHEYFCRHSSLESYNSQPMQNFLAAMSPAAHFLTQS